MKKQIICCVAGKSGGHIVPCLTIIQKNDLIDTHNILFFSSNTPLDKKIISENEVVQWHITLPLNSRKEPLIKLMWYCFYSFFLSFFYLLKHKPTMTITTGGIVAIPTCLASFILRIPITLYSLDAIPGKAIQFLSPLATTINTCFTTSQRYFPAQKCSIVSYPIKYDPKKDILRSFDARKLLNLHTDKKTLLILGGSQGSLFFNKWIKDWARDGSFPKDTLQVIHQTGSIDKIDWNGLYADANITAHVFSYANDLAPMYSAADLIICRAGAGSLFEIKFFNKTCIVIPLTTATTTHQIDNALAMSHEHPELFHVILQQNIVDAPTTLISRITHILQIN